MAEQYAEKPLLLEGGFKRHARSRLFERAIQARFTDDSIWIADAHRDDGKRYVVHADEKMTAFLELERAVCIRLLSEQR